MRYDHHVFICENRRPPGAPRPCCASKDSSRIREAFKAELASRGLEGSIRANLSGCLDACEEGPIVVVYPEGVWYGRVTPADVPEIMEKHLVGGTPVERLRLRDLEKGPSAR